MKGFVKKAASVVLALTMVGTMAACSKKSKSNEGLVEAANTVMDALLSGSSKKLKKAGEFSADVLMVLDHEVQNEAKTAVLKKATYEVDEDSIKESKKTTSVKVKISMPDYEAACEEAGDNLGDFLDAIEEQEKGDYKEEAITLKFTSEDDAYTLTNGDDIVNDLYMNTLNSLTVYGVEQAVPDKVETEPTDTESVPDTTPTTDPAPTETTAPAQPPVASTSAEYDVIIYQDASVIIHFIKVDSNGVHMKVENLTSFEITMQGNAFAVDGISITDFTMSAKCPGNATSDIVLKCSPVFSDKVANVSGELKVVDFDGNFKSYEALIDTTVIDPNAQAAPAAQGTPLYEDDKVKLYFAGLTDKGALIEVENQTAVALEVHVESLAVNANNYSDIHYYGEKIAPHSIGTALMECKLDASQAVGIFSGLFEFSDRQETFEQYYATVNTTVIDSSVQVAPRALEGSVILEDSNIRMTYKAMSDKGPLFDIENLSDRDLVVQAESLSLNQRGIVDPYLSVHMAPHSVCEVVGKTDVAVDASLQVGMVGGGIIIGDVVDRGNSYMVVLDNVVIDDTVQVEVAPEGTLFYEDEKVRLYYKGTYEKGIVIDVENLSGYSLTVQTRSLVLNDEEATGLILSQDAAPHGITEMLVRCKRENTDAITKVGGEFSIFNWTRDFDSYKATFSDVAVG